jgi:hypothetical protein
LTPHPRLQTPNDIADDHSLLKIDQELDFLMEQIEESGEASKEAVDRLQMFCQAMNVKVDRIGRYLAVMELHAEHCRKEAARYIAHAKRAQSKIDRTKAMVLYYLESHDLKQLETEDTTLRRREGSNRQPNQQVHHALVGALEPTFLVTVFDAGRRRSVKNITEASRKL